MHLLRLMKFCPLIFLFVLFYSTSRAQTSTLDHYLDVAKSSSPLLKDIRNQIASMQSVTGRTVSAIHEIGGTVGEMTGIANEVANAMAEQRQATAEIAKNVNLAAAGTKEVSRNISGVSSATLSTAAAASHVLEAADGLGRQEGALRAAVDGFLERVRQA